MQLVRNTTPPEPAVTEHDDALEVWTRPHWLTRWGATALAVAIAVVLAAAAMFSWPDVVSVPCVVRSGSEAVAVVASRTDFIDVWTRDTQPVSRGEILGRIGTTFDVGAIRRWLTALDEAGRHQPALPRIQALLEEVPSPSVEIAEERARALSAASALSIAAADENRMDEIRSELSDAEEAAALRVEQLNLLDRRISLATEGVTRAEALLGQGVSSRSDVEVARERLLDLQRQRGDCALDARRLARKAADLQREGDRLVRETTRGLASRTAQLHAAMGRLAASYARWLDDHTLVAPVDGRVVSSVPVGTTVTLTAGSTILSVAPAGAAPREIETRVPQSAIDEISPGSEARISLDALPVSQYGHIHGKVRSISPVSDERGYAVVLSITRMSPRHERLLAIQERLTGTADIITGDRSLLDRLTASRLGR